ncbi:ankyrin repeat-containing protein NPR4-like [Silene latifolia]|uniref:ankyrin repeat-containing protein NPR4-like n=1 Tax=Silene latifolia TaxID=37657 RepID=UPI003D76D600
MRIEDPRFDMIHRNDGTTVFHCLSSCPENIGKRLLAKYWWVVNMRDDKGNTALDYARQANIPWLVNFLTNPSLIQKQDFDWIEACNRGDTAAIFAFVNNCEDLQRVCREKNDTPLHHLKLPTYKDYVNFLKIPSIAELKNTADHDGATPLFRALEREDIFLAKTLLQDDKVMRTIAVYNDRTVLPLLAKLCEKNDEWEKMCALVKVNPYLGGSYTQLGNNLDQTRTTLSVVAALLATITFAAGFTLPGGINSNTGEALLATKQTFLIFLIADGYAMCSSMLTLFMLTWSMTAQTNEAWSLVRSSLQVLSTSLYATMAAFTTGIYLVIPPSSRWASLVIHGMCAVVAIWAILPSRNLFTRLIFLLTPAGRRESRRQMQMHEEAEMEIITSKDEERRIQ